MENGSLAAETIRFGGDDADARAASPPPRSGLDLRGAAPLAEGRGRLVFLHPADATRLVKVIRPERVDAAGQLLAPRRFKPRRRHGRYKVFARELAEYLALRRHDDNWPPVLAPLHGLVETSHGLGLVADKLTDREGRLAPNLRRLVVEGRVGPAERDALDALCCRLQTLHVVMTDLTSDNLVFAWVAGALRCVVVDGFGAKHLLPLRSGSRWLNARYVARRRAALWAEIADGCRRG